MRLPAPEVIWHDLECGSYREDLALWIQLAADHGGPVLDVGAGTGRVALELARAGHRVIALDRDPVLLAELGARAGKLPVQTVLGDGREFSLSERFPLIIVPMQTVQLLGGSSARVRFLQRVRGHLAPGGVCAIAISEALEPFTPDAGVILPLPDICERDGFVFSSQPTAVVAEPGAVVLERRREIVDPRGGHDVSEDRITLDTVTAGELEREALAAGLRPRERREIPATREYVASTVVMLGG